MHVVFAASTVALFASTIWMMADDHASEWRRHQQVMDEIERLTLISEEQQIKSPEYTAEVERLEKQIAQAEESLRQREDELKQVQAKVDRLQFQADRIEARLRTARAERGKAAADYDLAVRDELDLQTRQELYDVYLEWEERVSQLMEELETKRNELQAAEAELKDFTDHRDQLQAQLKQMRQDVDRIHAALEKIAPESWLARTKRKMLDWYILDGFSSVHEIKQDWLPELKIKLGMAETQRFDRCRSCHLGIDRVEAGNVPAFPHGRIDSDDPADWVRQKSYPHPYATHPRPELYCTASSPHPVEKFGCTICHEGQGSGTDFYNAQHGENDPYQAEVWEEEYHHHWNHFWEYPMYPRRLQEAGCLKCHHNVVELGVNPRFGASAPKLYRGFRLIERFGCFGCHEINGYSGGKAIGPDLRLEPNYEAVALQLLHLLSQQAGGPNQQQEAESGEAGKAAKTLSEMRRLAREIAEAPMEADDQRQELMALLNTDRDAPQSLLPREAHNLADGLKDVDVPGKYRKVGPSLRYLAAKTTKGWTRYWIDEPKRFRPTTTMPQFFHLTNQQDGHAAALMPTEVAAVAEYLFDKSQSIELLAPADGYQPDAERGKLLFSRRGCLACHSHKDFPEISADFGPDLSKVHEKIRPGQAGFNWLYTWLRDPSRHHARTRMPNLYLEPYTQTETTTDAQGNQVEQKVTVDPAADIAAFLLQGGPGEFPAYQPRPYLGVEAVDAPGGAEVVRIMPVSPISRAVPVGQTQETQLEDELLVDVGDLIVSYNGEPVPSVDDLRRLESESSIGEAVTLEIDRAGTRQTVRLVLADPLDDLVRLFLQKSIGIQPTETFLETRRYPRTAAETKGDEVELVTEGKEPLNDEQWRRMKLNYVGRRTLSRYGCFGCHDIPGFETARPIGTTLQDWGRKDLTKLAMKHIQEYLEEHGEPDGSSTRDRIVLALKKMRAGGVEAGEFVTEEEQEREMAAAFFYDNLLHHRRAGFFWQKLREPRSYDYRKIETRGYDERLRMPEFPVSENQIEAIATFVLGLVAEPPADKYVYQPTPQEAERIEGEFLLEKSNCSGCHMLELPQIAFSLQPQGEEPNGLRDHPDFDMTADDIAQWIVENRQELISGQLSEADYPPDVQLMQKLMERFGTSLDEVLRLIDDESVRGGDRQKTQKMQQVVRQWLAEHPEYLLVYDLRPDQGEYPQAVLNVLELKPPVPGATGETTEKGTAVVRFHGLLMQRIPGGSPELDTLQYQLWETLDVGGRVFLPGSNVAISSFVGTLAEPQLSRPPRGGAFSLWLVENLLNDRQTKAGANNDRAWGYAMAPPPLYLEGQKVQTDWLYRFLKNPEVLRYETVLRMPQFNLDDAEARALANYFAVVDGAAYPYQDVPQRDPGYALRRNKQLAAMIPEDSSYLAESWKLLNANVCIGCHSVGGKPFQGGGDPMKVTHGPDLHRVYDRLRPEWLTVWLAKPQFITPYTQMLIPKAEPSLFAGDADRAVQTEALRDALLNYPLLIEQQGAIFYDPKTRTVKPASEAEAADVTQEQ